ncbi:glycosyltransferase family 2 protein [Microbacterium capsulatum]|uniref:Glycosyltransferase family 2 protein n=1 Tax=Microbacterium capsulatum TaxID=3041921 RepID=A0ABU0XL94_9MICO|nr:glycosyltransferase family 2 protein [Microbacterium sp. ASV81]MDQ4215389.1 glycosyltransferase family 2 protein [Microbacterium sp. ASV81]
MPESSVRVGIVVRTKDRPVFLERALRDIAAQTFTDWSVVVVNDGGDPAPVDRLVAELPAGIRAKTSVIHRTGGLGRSAAANAGVQALSTEFLVLHDDDDLWAPFFLADSVAWLDASPADAGVVSRTEIVYERIDQGRIVETGREPFWGAMSRITYADMLQVNRFVPIAYLYRRALHAEVGLYREDVHAAEDWEFNLRVLRLHPIGYLRDRVGAYWMQRRGQDGILGNSMFVLADEHDRYDRMIRDEALRAFAATHGDGLMLYLSRFVQDEIERQLAARRSLGQRAVEVARRGWRRFRGR